MLATPKGHPDLVKAGTSCGLWPALTVSVCQNVSTTGHLPWPTASWYHCHASGLIGSPTVPRILRLERSNLVDTSEKLSLRYLVYSSLSLRSLQRFFYDSYSCVGCWMFSHKYVFLCACLAMDAFSSQVSYENRLLISIVLYQTSFCYISHT